MRLSQLAQMSNRTYYRRGAFADWWDRKPVTSIQIQARSLSLPSDQHQNTNSNVKHLVASKMSLLFPFENHKWRNWSPHQRKYIPPHLPAPVNQDELDNVSLTLHWRQRLTLAPPQLQIPSRRYCTYLQSEYFSPEPSFWIRSTTNQDPLS